MVRRSLARYRSAYGRVADSLNKFDWLANLLLRLSIGFMFFSGAVGKLADLGKFTVMFNGLGIPGAPVVAPAVAIIELVGGVKHPRFHAHLVTCDRCALRPGVERSTRPRLRPVGCGPGGA